MGVAISPGSARRLCPEILPHPQPCSPPKAPVHQNARLAPGRSSQAYLIAGSRLSPVPRLTATSLMHRHATIDCQYLAGDVVGLIRCEEGDRRGDLIGLAKTLHRRHRQDGIFDLLR
jgi:hypothetical protein